MGSFELDVLCHVDYHFIRSCANTAKHSQYSVFIAHLYTTIIWSGPKKCNTMMIIFEGRCPYVHQKKSEQKRGGASRYAEERPVPMGSRGADRRV